MAKKRPKYPAVIHWYCETWLMNFYFCIGTKRERFMLLAKEIFDHKPDVGEHAIGHMCGDGRITAIWVRDKDDVPSLAHECLHAVNHTMIKRGVLPDFNNDEAQAYLMTALMTKALE